MVVDRDEALERLRDARDATPLEARQRDDPIAGDDPAPGQEQLVPPPLGGERTHVRRDAVSFEQQLHGVARLSPEQLERRALGADESQLHALDSARVEPGSGHQRELVGRQAPDRAGGHDERDAPHRAALDLARAGA